VNELRWQPLLRQWVVIADARQNRPQMPAQWCPFCPGSGRVPENYDVYIYPNDFAAFRLTNPPFDAEVLHDDSGLFVSTGARGATDVVLYHPNHNLTPAQLSAAHWLKVVQTWTQRYRELTANPDIHYIYIFENTGVAIGVTMPHPHGQIYSFPFIPPLIEQELDSALTYFEREQDCIYCEILRRELEQGARIVAENECFVAFVPYAARFPAELQICARRHVSSLPEITITESANLAALIKQVRMKYDNLFGFPMPLMMLLRHPPAKGEHPYFHFHIDFYPIQRSATKLKYLAGVETGAGTFLNDTVPEETARELRETEPR